MTLPRVIPHALVASVSVLAALCVSGCVNTRNPAVSDGGGGDAADVDGNVPLDDGGMGDGFVPMEDASTPDGSVAAPAAEILRIGTGGFLLRGASVIAPTGPIANGEVLVVGNTIRCVAVDCTSDPMAADVTIIDTHATITAGLIDAHNHLTYNFLPEWVPDPLRIFGNRYEWRGDAQYRAHVAPEGDSAGATQCAAIRWGELRSMIHGTTTMQGQSPTRSCGNGLVRNADHAHGLGSDHMQTTISGSCESALSDTARPGLIDNFRDGSTTRYAIHMGEGPVLVGAGTTTDPTRELDCYAGRFRSTISLLNDLDGSPFNTALFIHTVPFDDADINESIMSGAHFVWSPSSNILLYGRTAPIGRMIDLGARIALGPDWTVSGSDELLSEMRFALEWAAAEIVSQVTPAKLVEMATTGGADAVGLSASIGELAPGLRADIAVFGRIAADPYIAVTDSRAQDVRLVIMDGAAYYGDLALEMVTSYNGLCDDFDACGTPKFLCASGTTAAATSGAETVDEIRTTLRTFLDAGGYLVTGADLQELVDCSL